MKKIVTLFITALFSLQLVSAQKQDTATFRSPQALHDFYMHRYHIKKTVAIVCLTGGIVMTTVGLLVDIKYAVSAGLRTEPAQNARRGVGLSNIGFLTTLASIPSFISAGSSKRRQDWLLKEKAYHLAIKH